MNEKIIVNIVRLLITMKTAEVLKKGVALFLVMLLLGCPLFWVVNHFKTKEFQQQLKLKQMELDSKMKLKKLELHRV